MTKTKNRITPIEQTQIRRINRAFQVFTNGNTLQAVLPLPVERFTIDNTQHETFNQHLIVENTGEGYRAEIFVKGCFKRKYWHKWRDAKVDLVEFTEKNFHELIKRLKFVMMEAK